MSVQLPSEITIGAILRGQEYGWTLDAFPPALRAAERLEIACLGGQFQFRMGESVYEPFRLSAHPSERRSGEGWSNYVCRSCCEVGQAFELLVRTTDFRAVAREWRELRDKADAGLDTMHTLVFVAYFVTEQEYNGPKRIVRARVATSVAGVGLLIPAALGLLMSGVPTILSPFPILTIIPAFVLGEYLAVGIPALFFLLWHRGLFRGESDVPRRSYILLSGALFFNILWFLGGWKLGVEYEGIGYTRGVCAVNIMWVAVLVLALARVRKREPSFRASLLLHWMLFAWLAWYAFPYLGELP